MAVPTMVKIPEPMTAPMPSEVRLSQPSDFLSRVSSFCESERSLSMLLQRKSGDDATRALRSSPVEEDSAGNACRNCGAEKNVPREADEKQPSQPWKCKV